MVEQRNRGQNTKHKLTQNQDSNNVSNSYEAFDSGETEDVGQEILVRKEVEEKWKIG